MMNNILKFHLNKKEKYSDKWLLNIKPVAIAKYILKKACYEISWRAARAIADAEIKNVYKEHTKVPMKKLDEILKHDLLWDAKMCLKYGLVDEVI